MKIWIATFNKYVGLYEYNGFVVVAHNEDEVWSLISEYVDRRYQGDRENWDIRTIDTEGEPRIVQQDNNL